METREGEGTVRGSSGTGSNKVNDMVGVWLTAPETVRDSATVAYAQAHSEKQHTLQALHNFITVRLVGLKTTMPLWIAERRKPKICLGGVCCLPLRNLSFLRTTTPMNWSNGSYRYGRRKAPSNDRYSSAAKKMLSRLCSWRGRQPPTAALASTMCSRARTRTWSVGGRRCVDEWSSGRLGGIVTGCLSRWQCKRHSSLRPARLSKNMVSQGSTRLAGPNACMPHACQSTCVTHAKCVRTARVPHA